MTYVSEQTSEELRQHMRRLRAMKGWNEPLADRLWKEVEALDRQNAELIARIRELEGDTGKSAEAWPSFYDYTHKPISDEPCPNCKGVDHYPAVCALCYGCGKLTALGKSHRDGYSRAAPEGGKEGGE